MYRIVFSFCVGSILIFMSFLPLVVHASNVREGRDDAPRGKIVGGGTRSLGYARERTLDRYQDNLARYYGRYGSYYGTYGYPTPIYNSYYGTTYGYGGYPASSYYGAYGYPTSLDSYYRNYDYNYPSSLYSTYPLYPNTYMYPGYGAYYPGGNMYNPNTVFLNPPSSLNSPTGYPAYSETYLYR